MLHPDDEVDRILVFHLLDVQRDARPLASVFLLTNVFLEAFSEGFEDLKRRVVGYHEVRCLPPSEDHQLCVKLESGVHSHGTTSSEVVHSLRASQQRVRRDNSLSIYTLERRGEQAKLHDKHRLHKTNQKRDNDI